MNYTWTGATNTLWSESTNWSPAGVPGALDGVEITYTDACEESGTCTLTLQGSSVTIAYLTYDQNSATIISTGSLRVTESSYLGGLAFTSLTLLTQGYTMYVSIYYLYLFIKAFLSYQ